jgi:ADP-heptose:LPS heptosyltransferase
MSRHRLTARAPLPFKYPAVIFGNALGDHLLALPAIRALASLFPSRLSLIGMPGLRRRFFSDVPLRSVFEIEMGVWKRRFDSAALAKKIGKCDLFLSLNPWRSVSLDRLVTLLSPKLSIGLSPAFHVELPDAPRRHAADSAFRVPAHLDPSLELDTFAFPPKLPAGVGRRIREFLKLNAPGKRLLAIHNETKPEKTWPLNRLSSFVHLFLERHPDFVVFILDLRKPKIKFGRFKDRIIHSRGLPLPYAFALLQESDLFLGVDSCMLHAADLSRIPGVGLFGPTEPRRWGFRFSPHRHVFDRRGLKHISETAVLRALESLLPTTRRRSTREAMQHHPVGAR